jgi:hypothetical protein
VADAAVVRDLQNTRTMMMSRWIVVCLVTVACGNKEPKGSKPATCPIAGQLVSQRFCEYADKAKVSGAKRVELDKAMADTIAARCEEDKWHEAALGCLGAMATVPREKLDPKTYNNGIDICTRAIGPESEKKLDTAVGQTVKAVMGK